MRNIPIKVILSCTVATLALMVAGCQLSSADTAHWAPAMTIEEMAAYYEDDAAGNEKTGKPDSEKTNTPKTETSKATAAGPAPMNYVFKPSNDDPAILEPSKWFVRNWAVLGPFPVKQDVGGDQQQEATHANMLSVEEGAIKNFAPGTKLNGKTWALISADSESADPGFINLEKYYNSPDYVVSYLATTVHVDEAINNAVLKTGSDDYIKVWVNGKEVFAYDVDRRGASFDQDSQPGISLKKGENIVVVKVVDIIGDYGFFLRFTDKDENTLLALTPEEKEAK